MSSFRITRARKTAPVRDLLAERSNPHQRVVPSAHVGGGAAPSVAVWCLDQPRAHRVWFNVMRGSQQIRLIDHERGESPLPEMPAPTLAEVDLTRVRAIDLADRVVFRPLLAWACALFFGCSWRTLSVCLSPHATDSQGLLAEPACAFLPDFVSEAPASGFGTSFTTSSRVSARMKLSK